MSAWTWETLNGADRKVLEEVMRTGATPDIGQLLGHTYRGLNSGLVPRITGRRFKKVFHEQDGQPLRQFEDARTLPPTTSSRTAASTCRCAGFRTSWCCRTPATTRWCSARPTS